MRICYLADGRYIHARRWLRYFSDRGHEMSLLSFAPVTQQDIDGLEQAGARYFGELSPFHLKRFWRTAAQISRLRKLLREEKIDVLHSHFVGVNAWYGALSQFHPAVITVMGGDILGEDWEPGPDIRERWLTPYALRNADLITCWSNKLVPIVRRFSGPEVPIEVVHGGVELERFSPGPRPQYLLDRLNLPATARVILSPRLMRPLYNLDKLAIAAQSVCAAVPEAYFVFAVVPVATEEAYEAEVRDIFARGDANDRVRFVGAIPHDEMADYYRLADVTVSIPSSDGTPMSVLESMACGTPVLVSRIPNYDSHYIEENKTVLMVDPKDPAALATALTRLLQDRSLAQSLASEAERRVRLSGSYESQMAKMNELYMNFRAKM
ncbi:MAG TPA: glycosyltransferase family 4 protein [Pyrinomonadaceae bacterium]|nr:glycosyltransferase family 4 protein [Pyrinomonadaceae bacterium]